MYFFISLNSLHCLLFPPGPADPVPRAVQDPDGHGARGCGLRLQPDALRRALRVVRRGDGARLQVAYCFSQIFSGVHKIFFNSDRDVIYVQTVHYVHTLASQSQRWDAAAMYGETILPAFRSGDKILKYFYCHLQNIFPPDSTTGTARAWWRGCWCGWARRWRRPVTRPGPRSSSPRRTGSTGSCPGSTTPSTLRYATLSAVELPQSRSRPLLGLSFCSST